MNFKRITAFLLLMALLCACLSACGSTETPSQTEETVPVGEPTEDATQPAETEPSVSTQTALDIETTGGVVIVGTIGTDAQGWFIQPEQPLNISFVYFLDDPSVYPETTRISMFDPKDDGFEKAKYQGQTVTATGTFRYFRDDFETLYFVPYTIAIGKYAECSFSAPTLMPPDEPQNLYDPSQPLPEAMDAKVENGKYSYNAFMLSIESLNLMGNDFADFYVDFVDAFLNYRSECECPDPEFAEMLSTIIYYELPMYNACAEPFEYFRHYDEDKGTVTIVYKHDQQEHTDIVNRITTAANEMLADVTTEQTDIEKAKAIYHALSTRMTYDYSALENISLKDSQYAYLNNTGVCVTFANVYNQLLTQVGIETTLAHCDSQDTYGHVWSIVTLDGQQYFCDPTYELSYDNGAGYRFFGLNYADRVADGTGSLGIRSGRYSSITLDASMIAAESLEK